MSMFFHIPLWQVVVVSIICGGLCYLAMVGALALCDRVEAFEDGPAPSHVPIVAIPIVFGVICGVVAARSAGLAQILMAAGLLVILAAAWASDARRGLVFDWFTIPALAVVVIACVVFNDYNPLIWAAIVAGPFAVAAALSKGRGMGWGDVKLVAIGAAVVGLQTGIVALVAACLLVSVVAFARGKRKEPISFAPYIAGCFSLALLFPQVGVPQ